MSSALTPILLFLPLAAACLEPPATTVESRATAKCAVLAGVYDNAMWRAIEPERFTPIVTVDDPTAIVPLSTAPPASCDGCQAFVVSLPCSFPGCNAVTPKEAVNGDILLFGLPADTSSRQPFLLWSRTRPAHVYCGAESFWPHGADNAR